MNVNVHSDFFPLHSHYFSYLSLFLLLKTCSRSGLKHDSLSRPAKYLRTFFSRDIRETRRLVIVYVSSNSKGRYTPPPPWGGQSNLAADNIECDSDDKVKVVSGREYPVRLGLLLLTMAAGDKSRQNHTITARTGAGDSVESLGAHIDESMS